MKVLQVASSDARVVGGMETVLRDFAEGLSAIGDDVVVLSSSTSLRDVHGRWNGVELVRCASLGKVFSQPLTPWLPMVLRRLSSRFDVVHLHMPNPLAEAATAMLPSSVPVVVTYHCDILRQRILKPFYGPVRRAILNRARRIVVPTENHIHFSEILPSFFRQMCPGAVRDLSSELRARRPWTGAIAPASLSLRAVRSVCRPSRLLQGRSVLDRKHEGYRCDADDRGRWSVAWRAGSASRRIRLWLPGHLRWFAEPAGAERATRRVRDAGSCRPCRARRASV